MARDNLHLLSYNGRKDREFDGGGGNGDDGHMDKRLTALETTVTAIKADLDVVKSNYATKADVAEIRADIHKMMLATVLTIIGTMLAAIFGVAQVFKGTVTKPASPNTTPIVIQVPVPAAPLSPPPAK